MSTKKNQKYSITLFENTLVCFMRLYKEIRRQKAEDYIPCLECDSLEKEFEEMQNDNDLSLFMRTLGNDSNLLIVFYVQIMPDDFVMQLHRF